MKKISFLTLLLSFFLLCTLACDKDDPQDQQLVIDSITKEPIANAKVELVVNESAGIFGGSSRLVETVYTDEEGVYQFESSMNTSNGYYEVYAFADKYFEPTHGQSYPYKKLVELSPEGYLKVHIQRRDSVGFVSGYLSGGQTHRFEGYKIDTAYIDVQRADIFGRFVFRLRQNGESQIHARGDSLLIPRHDTIFHEIIF